MAKNLQVLFLLVCGGAVILTNNAEALECYVCVPSRIPGVQFPDCITNDENPGKLTLCPGHSDVCMKSEVVVNGVTIHERQCGLFSIEEREGGSGRAVPDNEKNVCRLMDNPNQAASGVDEIKVCTCTGDGCNSAPSTTIASKLTFISGLVPLAVYHLVK